MDTDNYQERIADIKSRVGNYTTSRVQTKSFLSLKKINSNYYYALIPIVILILLLLSSPSFIKYTAIDEQGEEIQKISINRLLIWTMGISLCCSIGIFAFKYKATHT